MPDAATQTTSKVFRLPQTLEFLADNIEDIQTQIIFMEKIKVSTTASDLENFISLYRYIFSSDPTPTELHYAMKQHLLDNLF